jgi:hypothetical protein
MRLRPLSLLLLICLALRLGAGPHPCHGQAAPSPSPQASCHGMKAPVEKPAGERDDCCDPKTGDHSLCEQGCQRAAVFRVSLTLPSVQGFEELTDSPEQGAPSPFFRRSPFRSPCLSRRRSRTSTITPRSRPRSRSRRAPRAMKATT